MTGQGRRNAEDARWWGKALLSWASSLIISVMASALVVTGLSLGFPPFAAIERAGADMGAQLLWVARLDEDISPGFVFVDIDEAACRAFPTRRPDDCRSGKPMPAPLVADFVRSMRESDAAVVVVDVSPFEDEADRALLRIALIRDDGPWVIAPLDGRPAGENGVIRGDPSRDLVPSGAAGRLRLATFAAGTDADAGDGLLRNYARATAYYPVKGPRRWVPSAPYLAAMLADPRRAAEADCRFYGRRCAGAARNGPGAARPEDIDPATIVFSLPSLAMLDPENSELSESEQRRARIQETRFADKGYMRLVGSSLLKEGKGKFPRLDLVRGRVVVLGSSQAAAMDIHPTPLGPMAGSEVLINAARAFVRQRAQSHVDAERTDWSRELGVKIQAAFRASLAMLPAWLLIQWLFARDVRRWLSRVTIASAVVFVFACGMTGALFIEFSEVSESLGESIAIGRPVDILTPVLLLGLEGYAEAAKATLLLLEHALFAASVGAVAIVTRIAAPFRGNHAKVAGGEQDEDAGDSSDVRDPGAVRDADDCRNGSGAGADH